MRMPHALQHFGWQHHSLSGIYLGFMWKSHGLQLHANNSFELAEYYSDVCECHMRLQPHANNN